MVLSNYFRRCIEGQEPAIQFGTYIRFKMLIRHLNGDVKYVGRYEFAVQKNLG